jgi:hypothetical protein
MSAVAPTLQWHPKIDQARQKLRKTTTWGGAFWGPTKITFEAHLGTTLVYLGSILMPNWLNLLKIRKILQGICREPAGQRLYRRTLLTYTCPILPTRSQTARTQMPHHFFRLSLSANIVRYLSRTSWSTIASTRLPHIHPPVDTRESQTARTQNGGAAVNGLWPPSI